MNRPNISFNKGATDNFLNYNIDKLILGTVILNGTEKERKNEGQQGLIGKKYWQTYRD